MVAEYANNRSAVKSMLYFKTAAEGVIFKVYVQPRASGNEFCGEHQDAVKIRLTAPPVKGEANKACLKFLAKQLKVPKSDLEIVAGQANRKKQVLVRLAGDAPAEKSANRIKARLIKLANKKGA